MKFLNKKLMTVFSI